MKVIIVGAGEVGRVSAETVSKVHDVLVIEKDEAVSNLLKSRLNVSTLKGDGTNPRTLAYAIANHNADMIISTLHSDALNMFVCMLAKNIDKDIITVSSINDPDFKLDPQEGKPPLADIIISPDLITAEKMFKLCVLENAVDYESVPSLGISVAIFAVEPHHDVVGHVVMHLRTPAGCTVFALYRDDILYTDTDTMEIHAGDRLCVFGSDDAISEFNSIMGVEDPARNFVVLGGSIVGINVAKMLAAAGKNVKIIDKDTALCRDLARSLSGVSIANADYLDPEVQINENVFRADATMTTSHADDTNLLMTMTAQKHNARKVITRYFTKEYEDIFEYTGIETIIGYYTIVSNEITKCTISDETAIMRLRKHRELFFKHTVDSQSGIRDRYLGDLSVPEGTRIVAVRREGSIMYPLLNTRFIDGDEVIVFTGAGRRSDLVKMFGKNSVPEV